MSELPSRPTGRAIGAHVVETFRLARRLAPRSIVSLGLLQVFPLLSGGLQVWVAKSLLSNRDGMSGNFAVLAAIGLVTAFLSLAALAVQSMLTARLGESVRTHLVKRVHSVMSKLSLRQFDNSVLLDSTQRIETSVSEKTFQTIDATFALINGAMRTIGVAGVLVYIRPALAVLVILTLTVFGQLAARQTDVSLEFMHRVSHTDRRIRYLSWLVSARTPAVDVRSMRMADGILRELEQCCEFRETEVRRASALRLRRNLAGLTTVFLLFSLAIAGVAALFVRRSITTSEGVALMVGVLQLAVTVSSLPEPLKVLAEAANLSADLRVLTQLAAPQPDDVARFERLELAHVDFKYPNSTENTLTDISVRVSPGERIAIVGQNGSGKSTLARLMASLYVPGSGSYRWNNEPVQEGSLTRNISYVPQDHVVPSLSLQDSLDLCGAVPSKLAQLCSVEPFAEFVRGVPLSTLVGGDFGGRELSGGQRQLFAVLRALARDADIVILDEPTASLDPATQSNILVGAMLASTGTLIVVTHSFAVLKHVSRIILLVDGQVVADGPLDEIKYSSLFRRHFAADLESYEPRFSKADQHVPA